jgi:hypothetical protein
MNAKAKERKIAPTRKVYVSHNSKIIGEPSLDEILASIRKIIMADETRDKKLSESKEKVALSLSGIVTAKKKTAQGFLIKSTSLVWNEVARALGNDWSRAFEIPPEKWEEIVAGAFDKRTPDLPSFRRRGRYSSLRPFSSRLSEELPFLPRVQWPL